MQEKNGTLRRVGLVVQIVVGLMVVFGFLWARAQGVFEGKQADKQTKELALDNRKKIGSLDGRVEAVEEEVAIIQHEMNKSEIERTISDEYNTMLTEELLKAVDPTNADKIIARTRRIKKSLKQKLEEQNGKK